MNKYQFICVLRTRLSGLPEEDVNKSIDYYCELIDDYIEDGKSEQEAVAALGDINDIVTQILSDIPITKLVKAKINNKRSLNAWEIALIVIGSPVWVSLLIALFSIVFSVYISLWAVVVSLYAVVLSLGLVVIALFVGAIFSFVKGLSVNALIILAAALVLIGVAILLCIGTTYCAKGLVYLITLLAKGLKRLFVGRSAV